MLQVLLGNLFMLITYRNLARGFAKICEEVDAFAPLPESFDLSLPSGASFPIRVWYPWKSLKCDSCHVFGHESCEAEEVPMVSRQQVWVANPPVLSVVGAPSTNIAAVVSPNKVSPLAGGFVVVSPIVLPPPMNHLDDVADGCTDNGEMEISKVGVAPVMDSKRKAAMVGSDHGRKLLSQSHGSSSGTKAGENMFSVLQSLQGDEGQVSLENSGGDPITLPTDEEFDAGMTLDLTSMVSPPKKKGRGCSKGVKKPIKDGDSVAPLPGGPGGKVLSS